MCGGSFSIVSEHGWVMSTHVSTSRTALATVTMESRRSSIDRKTRGPVEELAVDGCIGLEDRRDRTDLSQRIGFNCEGVLVAEMQLGTHQTGLQGRRGRSGRIGVRRHVLL